MANEISKRASLLAVTLEVTEGTPVAPSSGADYVPLQDDFSFESAFEELTSAELNGSIGQAKTIIGVENPTWGTSSYLKASGTEGVEPGNGKLIQAAMGAKSVASTEYNTVASSTVSVVKVDAGEGATFERGEALLVKDATNGYSIRNVFSISTDDLTLGFNLPAAPGTGVNLGKAAIYKPADSAPSITGTEYEGNGGLVQMVSGSKVTSMAITADPNNLLVARFDLEGTSYYRDPFYVASTDQYIDFNIGGSELNASVALGWYKTPHALASALQTAMQGAGGTGVTVVYNDTTGKFIIAKPSGTLNLLWNTGANTANTIGNLIGFSVAADDTGSLTYTADNAISYAAPHTPSYDTTNALVAKNGEVYMGDADDISCFGAQNVSITVNNTLASIPDICEESGRRSKRATARAIEMSIVATASKYDVSKFERFRNGTNTPFMMNIGEKSGGNWVPGKCVNFYCPTATITADVVADTDDVTVFNLTVRPYVENGLGEFYINFV
jgi:hypothetical protein